LKRVFAVILLAIACGCANADHQAAQKALASYYSGNYKEATNLLEPLAKKTNEDFVLNNVRLGSVALTAYDLDEAENAFLRAYEVINSTGVNNGGRTLGAVLVDEKVKVWKGEPFERAMANFYLGVIYYMRQDYNNARGAFENALFKLRDYADPKNTKDYQEVESNFVPALVMLAKSYQRIGREDLARANFEKVQKVRPDLVGLIDYDRNLASNLLLVVDFGAAPSKVTDFDGSIVGFAPTPTEAGPLPRPTVRVDGQYADINALGGAPVDLVSLATDRRWQSIDTLRAIKSAVGTGLIAGGAVETLRGINGSGARQRTDLMVGAGLLAGGLLLKATSQADVRHWETLPRTVYLIPIHLPSGQHDVTVSFPNGEMQSWHRLVVPESGEATYYLRMQRWNSGPFDWPPATIARTTDGSGA
jgi:tetratricopeptide (TPR) repeat protein